MTDHRVRRAALLGGTALLIAAGSQGALAQDTDADVEVEEMVVTGSRLIKNELVAPNPLLSVGSEEIDFRGAIRIEDLTNILPQVFAGQASEVANGATGTATLNLRGLGSIRTLVLIDGKRLPFGSPGSSAANISLVPAQLIDRIDIVTGGASAVYGADAVGGVANFVLKRDFEGLEFDGQVGVYHAGNQNDFAEGVLTAAGIEAPGPALDGRDVFATLTLGVNSPDDRGNITAFLSYQSQNEISQEDRVGSACAYGPSTGTSSFQGVGCVGSSTFRRFFSADDTFQEEDGTLVPFVGGPEQTFNFGPFNFFQRPNERFLFYTQAHYAITDDVEIFADLHFFNNATDAQIAPSGSFFRSFQVNCANPFLDSGLGPDGEGVGTFFDLLGCAEAGEDGELPETVPLSFGRRNVEGGPRNTNIDLTTWRMVGGFRGTLLDTFEWEAFGQFARTLLTDISEDDLVFDNVQDALFVVEDEDGNPVCESGNAGCVPYNVFGRGPNGETLVTDEAVDFIQGTGLVTGETQQIVIHGTIQTDLTDYGIQSPLANAGISILGGIEYREDMLEQVPDQLSQIPGGMGLTGVGGGTLPIAGEVRVVDLFTEVAIPLVDGAPLVESLAIGGAYRYSDYTTDGNDVQNSFSTDTFHAYINYAPTLDLRFRAQFQRSVRAPNVIELFTGQNTGLFNLSPGPNGLFDPCSSAPGIAPSATLEQCMNTGVTAEQFGNIPDNPAGQFNSVTGGNPFLEPESSDTFSIGGVFTPSFLPGFSLSIDYFDIEVDDAVATIPPQTTLDNCIATGDPAFCDLIVRDQFGSLFLDNANFEGVQATLTNIATLATSGIDFRLLYDIELADLGLGDLGALNIDYASTYLFDSGFTPLPGEDFIDCAGEFAGQCGAPTSAYRHRMLATWSLPFGLTVSGTWRFFTSVDNFNDVEEPFIDVELPTVSFFDIALSYQVTDNVGVRFGVLNVGGREAPFTTAGGPPLGNGNTFPTIYDATGRFIFFGVNFRL
ncbi:MAG: TonB-dependent receptor domain-containing protein [Rhodothalassiaceae bacterium]